MVERRKWKRYEIGYPIEGEKELFNLNDVSRGGIAFTAGGSIYEGDRVDLRIFLKHKMFKIKALIVYAKETDKDVYSIGAKFLNEQEEFHLMLEKEVEEIKELYRESNLYDKKAISFKQASSQYLERERHG